MSGSANRPSTEIEPKGGKEHLVAAVQMLGPFSSDGRLSEPSARRQIERLARSLQYNLTLESDAPNLGEVIDRLRKSIALTVALQQHLSSFDDVSRYVVRTAGIETPGFDDSSRNKTARKHQPVDKFLNDISVFSHQLIFATELFEARFAGVGRNANMHKRLVGVARTKFIQDGLLLFEEFKPGKAKGGVGSVFYHFLMQIFEYATGKEGEVEAKLTTELKDLVGAYKAKQKEEARYATIYNRREILRADQKTTPDILSEIDDELERSGELMKAHWLKFMPQLRN